MNGCMLLALLVLAGQVGQGLPTGQLPMEDNVSFRSTEYGWKINPESNELEYIVQISPEKANFMVEQDKEFASEMHPEVAVRIRKIVVRIGSDMIESLPLSAVRRLPPVAAPIETNVQSEVGKGRFAQLESGIPAELKNVAGGPPPLSLPAGGVASNLTDTLAPPDNLSDGFKGPDNLIAQNTIDSFLDKTRGGVPNSSAGSKFSNTGTAPAATGNFGGNSAANPLPGANSNFPAPPASNLPGMPPVGNFGGTGAGQQPLGGTPGFGQSTTPLGTPPASASTPNYATTPYNAPGYATGPANTTGNFGAPPRSTAMQPPSFGQGQTGSPYVQPNDPPSYLPSTRIADNRGLPTTSGGSLNGNMATSSFGPGTVPGTVPGSASDVHSVDQRNFPAGTGGRGAGIGGNSTQPNMNDYQRTGMENIVPVMFVLSLVVNFYLGMLIRKLLGRYRTLLASVRSQTI